MHAGIQTIGVIRLHRLGDILQTVAVLQNIRSAYPQAHLTLITSQQFSYLLEQFTHIDELICIDTNDIKNLSVEQLCQIDVDANPHDLPSSLNLLRHFNFDLLVNLHADPYVAWLTGHIKCQELRGRKLLPNGGMALKGKWLFYFAACVRHRELALTNIVDIWSLLAGAKPLPALRYKLHTDFDAKTTLGLQHNRINIALQPGSADPHRRWPPEYFIQFAKQIAQHIPTRFIVLGSKDEAEQCRKIAEGIGQDAINASGYNLLETAKILSCTKLFLTGDTGPMHLAALLGTRIMPLYFGRTIPAETGPYTNQAISLISPISGQLPRHEAQGQDSDAPTQMRPEFVVNAALWALQTNLREVDLQKPPLRFMGGLAGSKAYVSQFNPNTAKFEQHALHYDSAQVEEIKTAMCAFLFFRYWQHLPEWNTRDQGPLQIKIDLAFEASELICATQRALGDYSEGSSQQAISALLEDIKTIQNVFSTNDKTQMMSRTNDDGAFSFLVDLNKILTSTTLLSQEPIPVDDILMNFIGITEKILHASQGINPQD